MTKAQTPRLLLLSFGGMRLNAAECGLPALQRSWRCFVGFFVEYAAASAAASVKASRHSGVAESSVYKCLQNPSHGLHLCFFFAGRGGRGLHRGGVRCNPGDVAAPDVLSRSKAMAAANKALRSSLLLAPILKDMSRVLSEQEQGTQIPRNSRGRIVLRAGALPCIRLRPPPLWLLCAAAWDSGRPVARAAQAPSIS